MALTTQYATGFRAAHEAMARVFRQNGMEPDYSVSSLEGLERILAQFHSPAGETPASTPDELRLLQFRAGAYAAEVLLRAVPGADVSIEDGELAVALPGGPLPGMVFKAYPRVRVATLLREEETLLGWAIALLALTANPPAGQAS